MRRKNYIDENLSDEEMQRLVELEDERDRRRDEKKKEFFNTVVPIIVSIITSVIMRLATDESLRTRLLGQ